MSSWVNRSVIGGGGRNGTTSHTVTFTAASSGSLLVATIAGGVTSTTPTGWTAVQSAVNFAGLYVFRKTATAGESSFTTTHNGSNYPIDGIVYEFASGSTVVGTAGTATGQAVGSAVTGPNCTSLTGTYTRFAVRDLDVATTAVTGVSAVWTTPSVEDYDSYTAFSSTDGIWTGIAYDDGASGASFTPSATVTRTGTGTTTGEGISFAVNVVAPSGGPTLPELVMAQPFF